MSDERIKWGKTYNQEFGEDKQSDASIDGECIGWVTKYRYSKYANWWGFCCKCQRQLEDIGDSVKEARRVVEEHYRDCR